VGISLTIENHTARTIDLYLRGRTPTFDVIVTRADGEILWQRLENEIIPAIVSLRTLGSAERVELSTVWDQRTGRGSVAEVGEYTARGVLLLEGESQETKPVPFRIERV
jgi:hypothetical protein